MFGTVRERERERERGKVREIEGEREREREREKGREEEKRCHPEIVREGVKGKRRSGERFKTLCVFFWKTLLFRFGSPLHWSIHPPHTHTQTVLCLHSGGLNGNGCLPMVLVIQGERGGGERCGEVN